MIGMGCGCLEKIIGFIFAACFVVTIPNAVWVFNIYRDAFEYETYADAFEDEAVYENITPLVLSSLSTSPPPDDTPPEEVEQALEFQAIVENLDQDDWVAIAGEVIPAQYLQAQAEYNLPILFDYLSGDEALLSLEVDTGILRDNLLGQPGDRMVNRIFNSWDECDDNGMRAMTDYFDGEASEFPYCKPNDAGLQRLVFSELNNAKDEQAAKLPEVWNLREDTAEEENLSLREVDIEFYENVQRPSVLMRELAPLWILMPTMFLALIMISAVGSTKSFFTWMGWSILIAGIFTLLPLAFLPIFLSPISGGDTQDITAIQAETLRGMMLTLVAEFTRPVLFQGALMVGFSFLLIFIGILLPNPDEDMGGFLPTQMMPTSAGLEGSTQSLTPPPAFSDSDNNQDTE